MDREPRRTGGKGRSRRKDPDVAPQAPPDGSGGERLARLVREVTRGNPRPAQAAPASREQEEDDILRGFLSRVFEINRTVMRQGQETDKEALASLYTARSFSSPEAMGRATRAVRELFQVNRRVAAGVEGALELVKVQVEASNWSERDKALFWCEVTEGFAAKFQLHSAILESQRMWADATAEAYEFALCHSEELRFEGKTVRASSRETGRKFVEKVRHAKHCREEFRAAAARFHRAQAAALERWDVTVPPSS